MTFLSPFIRNLSEKALMLRDLLKEDSMFVWEMQHQSCFDGLKHLVTTRSCLQYFNVAKTANLQTDASLLHGVLIINLESQLRLAAEVTGNSLSALLASHSYHVHTHICLCLKTLGLYIMIVNLTFRHCFNVSDRSVFILTKCHSARGI